MTDPNKGFKEKTCPDILDFSDHTDQQIAPPWEPFWSCPNFASEECEGDCNNCDSTKDEIDLLCEAKW